MKPLVLAAPIVAMLAGPAAPTPPPIPTKLTPLVVPGGPAPRLVGAYPVEGATVPAGVTVLALSFDETVAWTAAPASGGTTPAPPCLARPRVLEDGKRVVILCTTRPNQSYAIDLASWPGLAGAAGRAPQARTLTFTTDATITDNLEEALEQAGLTADADPIMGWDEAGRPGTDSPTAPAGDGKRS